jgi:hypothetical protein
MDTISQDVVRVKSARFVEAGADVYNFDVFIPANSLILDVIVHNEVLWTAATSAVLQAGDYAAVAGTQAAGTAGAPVISTAIDLDGFFINTDLKATDLLAGESINLDKQGGEGGAYSTVGTSTHITERLSLVDRFLRFSVTSVGAGTAGRTFVAVVFTAPIVTTVEGVAAAAL